MGNDWKIWAVLPLGLMAGPVAAGPLTLAEDSRTNYTIVTASGATVAEQHAAKELATFLKRVTGATFPIKLVSEAGEGPRLLVGPGEPVRAVAPDLKLEELGRDGFVLETRRPHLILAGDRPRGTLYAAAGQPGERPGGLGGSVLPGTGGVRRFGQFFSSFHSSGGRDSTR